LASRYRLTRAADLEALTGFRDLIDRACREQVSEEQACEEQVGIDQQTCYDLKLAVEEACMNVITHGYSGMNPGSIMLELQFDPGQVLVNLTDFGHPFEPHEPAAPDLDADLEDGLTHGFGLHFIYQTMDQISYDTAQDGNHLTFVKRLPASRKA
jgi:serine/threonine-protein kinase RsbW